MTKPIKQLFIDTETTGVDERVNSVIQIAGIMEITDSPYEEGDVVEEFNILFKPFEGAVIEPRAVMTHGITVEQMNQFPDFKESKKQLTKIMQNSVDQYNKLDKFNFIGFNGTFDFRFLHSTFERCGDRYCGSYVYFPPIEVATIAGVVLMGERHKMPNFKLGTVAEHVGVEVEGDLHDALTDIRLTRKLYYHFAKQMKK